MWLTFTFLLSLGVYTISQNVTKSKKMVTVGIIANEHVLPTSIAWSLCGGGLGLAYDKLRQDYNFDDFEFRFLIGYSDCDLATTLGLGIEYMSRQNADVVIGPPCPEGVASVKQLKSADMDQKKNGQAGLIMAHLSNVYKKAWLGWGYVNNPEFSLANKYPLITTVAASADTIGQCALEVITRFRWDIVSIIYTTNEVRFCDDIMDSLMNSLSDANAAFTPRIALKQIVDPNDDESYKQTLRQIKARSRVVIFCMDLASDRRTFLIKADQMGMTNNEYVFFMLGLRSNAFGRSGAGKEVLSNGGTPVWEDGINNNADGMDAVAKSAAKYMIVLDLNTDNINQTYFSYFKSNAIPRVQQSPLDCKTVECLSNAGKTNGAFARQLHDTFYAYGLGLVREPTYYHDAENITNAMLVDFAGLTGQITMTENSTRAADFMLYFLDANMKQDVYMQMTYLGISTLNVTLFFSDERTSIWALRNGVRPISVPICGFSGTDCPKEFWKEYALYVGIAIALLVIFIAVIVCLLIHFIRERLRAQQRLMDEWKIAYSRITLITAKELEKNSRSYRSLQSGPSTMTASSVFENEDSIFTAAVLDRDPVLITKHPPTMLSKTFYENCYKLRKLDHDNINKFLGFSFDGLDHVAVWKMCPRGSLLAVISKSALSTDSFFVQCIIRDVAEGLNFLHRSFIGFHGRLTSASCLLTDTFQVKICDYGVSELSRILETKHKLWTAPEVLRASAPPNTKPGDLYSFAIIAAEVITRRPAWLLYGDNMHPEDIIIRIKKSGSTPTRPILQLDMLDVPAELVTLVRSCWSENPGSRPLTHLICEQIREFMKTAGRKNLMDHVFAILEEHTVSLELEVEDRSKELVEEQKKADLLLGRMLPKQVAERLKLGQSVEPEGFDNVTVFFSDVVKFTQLSAKCTPFQVVNLLNDLYGNFDAIIEEHSAYKVESIGDGYLCVSGLPTRNGFEHIKEIVEMSLGFMDYCANFRIGWLPRERVQLRIGVNSGPCMAGVVGLSMPRYCLFGDTVNTASRMESNGKPGKIHLSGNAYTLLERHYAGLYDTESRGDVIIKGKGVMETYWVHGRRGEYTSAYSNEDAPDEKNEKAMIDVHASKIIDDIDVVEPNNALHREYKLQNA